MNELYNFVVSKNLKTSETELWVPQPKQYLVNSKGAVFRLNSGHLILEDFVAETLWKVFAEADDTFPDLLR